MTQTQRFDVLVEVTLKPGIADPQGATIERSLPALGFGGVEGVRVGKAIRFTIEASDDSAARATVDDLCARFLANPVIEQTVVTLTAAGGVGAPPSSGGGLPFAAEDAVGLVFGAPARVET